MFSSGSFDPLIGRYYKKHLISFIRERGKEGGGLGAENWGLWFPPPDWLAVSLP